MLMALGSQRSVMLLAQEAEDIAPEAKYALPDKITKPRQGLPLYIVRPEITPEKLITLLLHAVFVVTKS